MANKNELTCTFRVNGEPVEKLTEEHIQWMSDQFSKKLSEYYSLHPEEYKKL